MLTSSPEKDKFVIEPEIPSPAPSGVRFVIRGEGRAERRQAIREFEREIQGADLLLKNNEPCLAKALLCKALNTNSREERAIRKMIELIERSGGDSEERLKLAKAYHAFSQSLESSLLLAKTYYDREELDQALDLYFKAATLIVSEDESVFEIYKDIGNIYVRQHDFEGAEEYYHKAFALNPDSDVLQVNLGTLEVQRQDWGEARERFRTALTLNAKNDRAWVGLALSHHALGDVDLALANLSNSLDINPRNRTAVHLMAAWGQKYERRDEAIVALQNYLSEFPFDEDLSAALLELLCEKREYGLARLELEKLLCWNPTREDLLVFEEELLKAMGEA